MGVSNYWAPVNEGKTIPCNARSSFRELLEKAFGQFPIEIGEDAVPKLEAFRIAVEGEREAWDELISAIETHGRIRIWAGN